MRKPSVTTGLNQLLAVIAAVLLPLGLLVILLGWYGAAHTPYLFEQVPYLISGGLIGLALVTGAGLLYFGSWVARSAAAQQRASEQTLELLRSAAAQQRASEQTLELLREIRDGLGDRPARAATNGHSAGFVATARGSMWHRPDCAVVAGRQDLHEVGPDGDGLQPCALCNPLSSEPVHA